MAPRAGFEVERKVLSEQVARASSEASTSSDTPRLRALGIKPPHAAPVPWRRAMVTRSQSLWMLEAMAND
jgi:hypothetical protein